MKKWRGARNYFRTPLFLSAEALAKADPVEALAKADPVEALAKADPAEASAKEDPAEASAKAKCNGKASAKED